MVILILVLHIESICSIDYGVKIDVSSLDLIRHEAIKGKADLAVYSGNTRFLPTHAKIGFQNMVTELSF